MDRKILAELQENGRLTVTELADRIGLSVSPCHRRVKVLEDSHAIRAYRAHISPAAVGLHFSTLVFATLKQGDDDTVDAFEEAITTMPSIISAQRLFGDPDYLLHVFTADLPSFQRLYDERLSCLSGVQRLTSTLVMKEVVRERPLPFVG